MASDALYALRAAVLLTQCPLAVCDVDGNGRLTAGDALRILIVATGGDLELLLCPPASTSSTTIPENRAPTFGPPRLIQTYGLQTLALETDAIDPDDDTLSFSSPDLPAGAVLDAITGQLNWTPTQEQIGSYSITLIADDDGIPTKSALTNYAIQVQPPNSCVVSDCSPERGCDDTPLGLETLCCDAEPLHRIAVADVECPQGRLLRIGRNRIGFGRIQSCDLLQMIPFAQSGASLRFHVETRCLKTTSPIQVSVHLEVDGEVLVDDSETAVFQQRDDGIAQALGLFQDFSDTLDIQVLRGREAQFSVTATDVDGASATETLRVVLVTEEVADLPNPDRPDVEAEEAGCIGCHRPLNEEGERVGIEEAHPAASLSCIDCHGGNVAASTKNSAHVSPAGGAEFLRNLSSDELDNVDRDYLRFINPGDFRVAAQSCGPMGCHPEHVANTPLSSMSTYAAHYTLPRYLAGSQDREAIFAAVDRIDPHYDAATAPEGTTEALGALRGAAPSSDRSLIPNMVDEYLPKGCPTCHLSAFGRNEAAGTYRSSGCTACHMLYAEDGRSDSSDPRISHDIPPHPTEHVLTSAIPTSQCTHCHFQGGRIGLAYQGIREGGFSAANTPPNAQSLGRSLYGHGPDFYFSDEDTTNSEDETPPDLHFEAGMDCIDCHVGRDLHGDGSLFTSERHQVGIRCEDCHGTVRQKIVADPADGFYKNEAGYSLKRLREDENGFIKLRLAVSGEELFVPQLKPLLDQGFNPFMNDAMGVNAEGFSHTDKMECYACHTSWRLTCMGCHVTVDDTTTARNHTTGEITQGGFQASRDHYSIDFFTLGINERGKISPLCSSMSMFFSYVDENGVEQVSDKVRTSHDGKRGFGWNPFHHHTVSRQPQNCDRCHPVASNSNEATLRATYGFGSGEFLTEDGEGTVHDLTRFLTDEGALLSDFPHPNTGPVPADVRQRALGITVFPHPR